jgi:uncharacterized protein (TIGR00725 family)
METRALVILISGAARPRPEDAANAESVGRLLALAGATVLTGGRGGVMEAASRGAREAGGETLAILPGSDAEDSPPNPYVMRAVFTGMEDARNAILVRSADAVIAVGGGWGTLSEIALARKIDRPVVLLGSWDLTPPDPAIGPMPPRAGGPAEAVKMAIDAARHP